MKPGTLLKILTDIKNNHLPEMLRDNPTFWNSLDIDYHPPFVKRLWRQWGDFRILLHTIQPCTREQALFHPHPWPSAVMVVSGDYEMGVGYGPGPQSPDVAMTMEVGITNGLFSYEMINPLGWHYVRPLDGESMSVMLVGRPWGNAIPQVEKVPPLKPLTPEDKARMLDDFQYEFQII